MAAPIGARVGLYVDASRPLRPGMFVRTLAGRTYEVLTVRVQARGRHKGRQHFTALVVDPAIVDDEQDEVLTIRWYRR